MEPITVALVTALASDVVDTAHQAVLNEELSHTNLVQNEEITHLLTNLVDKLSQTENGKEALSKYTVNAEKIGVVGDNAHIKEQSF